jgi:uncharacterized protein (TIGR01777 family)
MKVAITGATGFVGRRLVERLAAEGHQVIALTRQINHAKQVFSLTKNLEIVAYTPTASGDWQQALADCDGVVNLAGEPIAEKRWTAEEKSVILNSRKQVTQKLVEAIQQTDPKPGVLVNASAIGYYGTSETAVFDETSGPGDDFLAEVCQVWETEAAKVKDSGVRLVILRLGIVLDQDGGALAKMLPAFRLFAGGPIGSGKQWFSWIHREDVVNLILYALTHPEMEGAFNATAPSPVHMADLSQTLGQVLKRPSWLPVPGFALEIMLGDGVKVVLEGQQVLPKRTQEAGFQFQYPVLKPALERIVAA